MACTSFTLGEFSGTTWWQYVLPLFLFLITYTH